MKHKLEQLNATVHKVLSELITRKFPEEGLTISDLLISQNYRSVKVFLKTNPSILQKLNKDRVLLQKELGDKLKLKHTLVINFLIDDNYLENIDKLYEKIKQ